MLLKVFLFSLVLFFSSELRAINKQITLSSTTSTSDSGLLSYLNTFFKKKFDIEIKVLSLGTGQAIRTAMEGNVEILLVHHTKSELDFMNEGFGLIRNNLMYNDFIIVGPKNDNVACKSVEEKLKEIRDNKYIFISRGDESGTHKKELELWLNLKYEFDEFSFWYREIGQGMGNTLLMANEVFAYTLTDRATWISFKKKQNLKIICENKPPLFNQYGIILVNPKINKNLDIETAKIYFNWLLSEEAKKLINSFTIKNKQLFFYNHH